MIRKITTPRASTRRLKSFAALALLLTGLPVSRAADSAYSQAVKADNPMLYYRFEEPAGALEAADSSGGSKTGTYNDVLLGVPSYNTVLGTAAEFDGELSSVSVPELTPAAQFTLEAWIKPNVFSTWNAIYNSDGYPDGAVHFQLIDDDKVEFAMNGNAPEDINFGDSASFGESHWTYVAIAFSTNTSSVIVYVNGSPFNTNVYTTTVAGSFQPAHIGAWNGDDRQFDGLIDELAIYPAVLTPAQIQAHYRAAVGSFVSVNTQPNDQAVFVGGTATFTAGGTLVGATGTPLFQWQLNGEDIPGATNATYATVPLALSDDGARYRAVIRAPAGASATTREATVSVTDLSPTGYAKAVQTDKPAVYYRFEETSGTATAADSSSGNHPGSYTNVLLGNASFNAVLGGAARFDGSSSRLAVPALGTANQFTIEAWIKPEIYKTSQAVYTADEISPGAPTLELVDEGGMLLSIEGSDPTDLDFGDDFLFPAEEWKYVVLTYDSTNLTAKAYVDGELVEEFPYDNALPVNFGPAHIGAGTDVNSFYRGLVDEFAIYTNVLSENRILAHYATVTGPVISPQPDDVAIFSGNTASFTTGLITGFTETPSIRWQRNDADIPGATNATFITAALTDAESGSRYRAIITAGGRTFTTREASVSVTSLPPSGYRDAVVADAPIVYYRFEEDKGSTGAIDTSPSGNNGEYDSVILGQPSFSAVLGHAARFDDSSIELPPLGSPNQFTIEAWIKPDFFDEFNAIFTTDEWMMGSLHFMLVDDESIQLSLNAGENAQGEDQEEDAVFGGSSVFAPGEWRHVAITYSSTNSTAILYVNGSSVGTNVFGIPPVMVDLQVSHIGSWNGDERFYYGLIDEFAMYTKALSPERVLAHYQAAAGVTVTRPSLQMARSQDQLTISWVISGYVLEENNDLGTTNWQPVPDVTGNSVSVSTASGRRFFRLRKP